MTQLPNKVSARRVTLMASVAGLGLAVLLTGPSAFRAVNGPAWTGTALAAENMLQPTGFADIVAKVKPAVISVRVRMDAEQTASLEDNDDNGQTQPGAPLDRFFKQFGFKQFGMPDGAPNGMAAAQPPGERRGLGLLHLRRRLCGDQQPRGRSRQDRAGRDRRRPDHVGEGDRHRPQDRPRPDQGRGQRLPVRPLRGS